MPASQTPVFEPTQFFDLAQRYIKALEVMSVCGRQAAYEGHRALVSYMRPFLDPAKSVRSGMPDMVTMNDMIAAALRQSATPAATTEDSLARLRDTVEGAILLLGQIAAANPLLFPGAVGTRESTGHQALR